MTAEKPPDRHAIDSPDLWVDRCGDLLCRFAVERLKNPSIAEDLVQETFLTALHSRERFEGRSRAVTWLVAILKH